MIKILAIDDKPDNLIAIRALLKLFIKECEVVVAGSGKEGLRKARDEQPDTILLDIHMPEMDGFAVCENLKGDPTTAHIPVVILTAMRTDTKHRIRALESGADAFLTKPINEAELAAQVKAMLRIKKAEDILRNEKDRLEAMVRRRTKKQTLANEQLTAEIGERKKAEKTLRESEKKYRTIFENSVVGFFQSTPEGRFTAVNQALAGILGYESPEDLMTSITDIATQFYAEPEDRRRWADLIEESGKVDGFEFRARCKDGSVKWLSESARACFDEHETFTGYDGVISDINDRKKAEQALRKSEDQHLSIIQTAMDGFCLTDSEGRLLEVNKAYCRMSGYSERELLAMRISDIEALESAEQITDRIRRLSSSGQDQFESRHRRKNGTIFDVEINAQLHPGEKDIFVCFFRDITERKHLEARVRQAQKMESIGNLAGGIAHDFNNLLFPIIGLSEMLLEDLPHGGPEHKKVRGILKAGKRGGDLVKQILAFSRQAERKKIPVRIQQVLKEVLRLIRSTIPSDIEILQDIQMDCGPAMADPTQIHQIAMNLITNAYHAVNPSGGAIMVRLKETVLQAEDIAGRPLQPGKYAMLEISDTGCGIDPSIRDRIFDPYFTTKEKGKGTGLGLAVVYGILREHSGDIHVHSEPGEGTTFTAYIPLMAKSSDASGIETANIPPPGTERILLVDDETAIVNLEKQMLERLGYRVTSRTSSLDALEIFQADPDAFDMVITDMTMPHMTGAQLAGRLISIKPGLPVIICTGYSERIDAEKAASLGINGFLMKPVARAEMAQKIRQLLDEAREASPMGLSGA